MRTPTGTENFPLMADIPFDRNIEQVRHRGGGGVVPPERTQVEDGL
jgi:hypothetical protein